jgi:tetratricopeptide (TPR) repeat protein
MKINKIALVIVYILLLLLLLAKGFYQVSPYASLTQASSGVDNNISALSKAQVEARQSEGKYLSVAEIFEKLPLVAILIFSAAPAILLIIKNEWLKESIFIEPFDMPKELQELGLSGNVMSQLLSDYIAEMQRNARVDDGISENYFVENQKLQIDFQLPGGAWSTKVIIRYIKQSMGIQEKRIIGDVIQKKNSFAIRLRSSSGLFGDVPVEFNKRMNLVPALKSAAEVAIALVDPVESAVVSYSKDEVTKNFSKTIALIKSGVVSVKASDRQSLYVLWASIHRTLGELDAMKEKLELAKLTLSYRWPRVEHSKHGSRYLNFVGNLHLDSADFQVAECLFRKSLRNNKNNIGSMYGLGISFLNRSSFKEARYWFDRIVKTKHNSSRGYRGFGLIALRSFKPNDALLYFKYAIDVAPLSLWPRFNYIDALRICGRFDEAHVAISAALEINPSFHPVFRIWAEVLRDQNNLEQALIKHKNAIDLNSIDPWNFLSFAITLKEISSFDEAINNIKHALNIRQDFSPALRVWGDILLAMGRREDAELKYRLSIRVNPNDLWGYVGLANLLRENSKPANALEYISHILTVEPNFPNALAAWGDILRDKGDWHGAEEKFRQAVAVAPHDPWKHLALATVLRQQERYDEATAVVEKVLVQRPDFPNALAAWGDILRDKYKRIEN